MTALVFHNQWDWFTFATLIILLAVAWLATAGLPDVRRDRAASKVTRQLGRDIRNADDERWLTASRCRELRDGSGE